MKQIKEFIDSFSDDLFNDIKSDIVTIKKQHFLVNKELRDEIKKIPEKIHSAGIFLGEDSKYYKPSLALLTMISNKSKYKVKVNKETEWLFLCGRDIFKKGIVSEVSANSKKLVLVQNELDENIGLGKLNRDGKVHITNLVDRGYFLRKEN